MKHYLRAAVVAVSVFVCAIAAHSQMMTVSGTKIVDSSNNPASNATICFAPVTSSGQPVSFRMGGGGQALKTAVCTEVTAGAWTIPLPDVSQTNPKNVCFLATATDDVSGASLLGLGYSCVQPSTDVSQAYWCTTSTTCNLDDFIPNLPTLALETPGPAGAVGPAGPDTAPLTTAKARSADAYTLETNYFDLSQASSGSLLNSADGTTSGVSGYTLTGYFAANAGAQMVANAAIPGTVTISGDPDQSSTVNLYNSADQTDATLINYLGGVESHSGYSESPYIVVSGLTQVTVNSPVVGGSTSTGWPAVFYDVNKNFLGATTTPNCNAGGTCTTPTTIPVLAGAYYMRYGQAGASGTTLILSGSVCDATLMAVAGATMPSSCTSFAAAGSSTITSGVAFYDASHTFISSVSGPISSGTAFTVPSTAVFARASFTGSVASTLMIVDGSTLPGTYVNFGTYARNTIDQKISAALGSVNAPLTAVWPAMQGLTWWLSFTDNTGSTVTDVVSGAHSGSIGGDTTTPATWVGSVGLVPNSQTITLPNAGADYAIGFCANISASNIDYIYGLAAGGHNGINLRGTYGPATGQYNGADAYYPAIGHSNGGNTADSLDGFSGVHCIEGVVGSNPQHIIVDGKEVNYLDQGSGTGDDSLNAAQLTAPIYIVSGSEPVYSAWATTSTETAAQAIARTSSEIERLKSQGVAFGTVKNSTAYDSTCAFDGTSIDQGFQAGNVKPSSLLSLDFSCTIDDFSISGQGSRDMDSAFDTRAGSVYHPKAAKNIAYTGGVTNGIINLAEPPALALQDLLAWNRKAHALGYKTIVSTMMSRTGTGYGGATGDVLAQEVNALILANGDEFDWVDNLAANPLLGATGASTNTTYFADGTHLNTTGQPLYVAAERAGFEGVYPNPETHITGSYTQVDSDRLVFSTATANSTVTLKDAQLQSFNRAGKICFVNNGSATMTLTPVNSETIDGASTLALASGANACLMPYVATPSAGGANWTAVSQSSSGSSGSYDASGAASTAQANAETYTDTNLRSCAGLALLSTSSSPACASSSQIQTAIGASVYDAYGAATTAQSNAETYAASQASTAQSTAEAYSANAGNISTGTINSARIPTLNQSTTGNSATATALAATPSNCSAGSAPTGIAANGSASNCTAYDASGAATTAQTNAEAYSANATNLGSGTVAQARLPATSTQTIASGTATLGTSAISSGACATAVTVSASGVVTTDRIQTTFSADPTSTTGYAPLATGMLTIIPYPTSGNVNFKVCNNTASPITPGAVTLNWSVMR